MYLCISNVFKAAFRTYSIHNNYSGFWVTYSSLKVFLLFYDMWHGLWLILTGLWLISAVIINKACSNMSIHPEVWMCCRKTSFSETTWWLIACSLCFHIKYNENPSTAVSQSNNLYTLPPVCEYDYLQIARWIAWIN